LSSEDLPELIIIACIAAFPPSWTGRCSRSHSSMLSTSIVVFFEAVCLLGIGPGFFDVCHFSPHFTHCSHLAFRYLLVLLCRYSENPTSLSLRSFSCRGGWSPRPSFKLRPFDSSHSFSPSIDFRISRCSPDLERFSLAVSKGSLVSEPQYFPLH